MKQRLAENMQINIAAERSDLSDTVFDLIERHKIMSLLIGTERTVQITGIRNFQIDPLHDSILL
jgi:hypothetical protein